MSDKAMVHSGASASIPVEGGVSDVAAILDQMDTRILTTSGFNNDTRAYGPTVYRRAADELRWLRGRNSSLEAEVIRLKKERKQ